MDLLPDAKDRETFVAFASPIFYVSAICYLFFKETPLVSIKTAQDITAIGIFAVTLTFFLLEIKDMFYGQAMKQIGQEERDSEIARKIHDLQEKGIDPKEVLEIITKDLNGHAQKER